MTLQRRRVTKLKGAKHIIANRIAASKFSQGKFVQGLTQKNIEMFVLIA
jgi:hypothetical protein